MGTRSTTLFIEKMKDKEGKITFHPLMKFYRQYDGYPEGHGSQIAHFLDSGILVNGINMNSDKKQFNGIGCLAAQVISHLKGDKSGGIYITPIDSGGEEYNYEIIVNSHWGFDESEPAIIIKCEEDGEGTIFNGTPKQFIEQYG